MGALLPNGEARYLLLLWFRSHSGRHSWSYKTGIQSSTDNDFQLIFLQFYIPTVLQAGLEA